MLQSGKLYEICFEPSTDKRYQKILLLLRLFPVFGETTLKD